MQKPTFFLIVGLCAPVLAACQLQPPPRPMGIIITHVSDPSPNLNDDFRIEWRYDPEEQLEDQFVEITTLTLEGNLQSQYHGCPPVELRLPNSPEPPDCGDNPNFDKETRVFEGRYTGPVQFTISARSADFDEVWDRRVIELRDENSFFKIGLVELSDTDFPRMGVDAKSINFLKFFGVINQGVGADTIVDDLAQAPLSSTFLIDRTFFGSSLTSEESDRFGFSHGSGFPVLEQDFLDTVTIDDTHAFAVLFGGGIVIPDARTEEYLVRTDEGAATITTLRPEVQTDTFRRHPLFAQIDLVNLPPTGPVGGIDDIAFAVSNVRFGNPDQGLVLAAFPRRAESGIDTPILITSDPTIQLPENAAVASSNGALWAMVSFPIVTQQGNSFEANATLSNVEWQNVPAYRDDRLNDNLIGGL